MLREAMKRERQEATQIVGFTLQEHGCLHRAEAAVGRDSVRSGRTRHLLAPIRSSASTTKSSQLMNMLRVRSPDDGGGQRSGKPGLASREVLAQCYASWQIGGLAVPRIASKVCLANSPKSSRTTPSFEGLRPASAR